MFLYHVINIFNNLFFSTTNYHNFLFELTPTFNANLFYLFNNPPNIKNMKKTQTKLKNCVAQGLGRLVTPDNKQRFNSYVLKQLIHALPQ